MEDINYTFWGVWNILLKEVLESFLFYTHFLKIFTRNYYIYSLGFICFILFLNSYKLGLQLFFFLEFFCLKCVIKIYKT